MLQIGSTPRIDTPSAVEVAFRAVIQDVALNTEHGGVLGIFLPIFPNETMSDGIPQVGCAPVVREPSTPASAFLPPTALLHSRGAMPPTWLPPQQLSYRIAQSVQGPSPRFLFGLSLVCTHAVLRPRRLSNTAASSWEHSRRGRAAHLTHTTKCPPPHMHNLPPPSRTARLIEERALTARSPPSRSPLATCRYRTLTRLGSPNQSTTRQSSCRAGPSPQGWQLSLPMWLHKHKELGSPRLATRARSISPTPGFTSDSLFHTSHSLSTHL